MKRISAISLFLFISLALCAQDVSRQSAQKKRIEQEIANIDSQLNSTKNKQKESLNTLALTHRKIDSRKRLLREIDSEIKRYESSIENKGKDIQKLQARLDTLQMYHNRLVYNTYKNRDAKIWFIYILASDNLSQSIRRWSHLKELSNSVRSQGEIIIETQKNIQLEREELKNLRLSSIETQKQRESEFNQLTKEEASVKNTINNLKKQEKSLNADLNNKKREVERLNREIERILAEAVKEQKGGKSKIDYELSAKFSDNMGKLPWPVKAGVIVEKFGQSYHPVFKNVKLPFNNGVNISTNINSDAYSVFNGVVKQVLVMPGYNQCVLVQHGEYFTFYTKLKRVYVKIGQQIKTGEAVGTIDDTDGVSILHFQLWKGTNKQNPENWLADKD